MKRVRRNRCEKLYGSTFNKADETEEFFERYKVLQPTQKERNTLKSHRSIFKIEFVL